MKKTAFRSLEKSAFRATKNSPFHIRKNCLPNSGKTSYHSRGEDDEATAAYKAADFVIVAVPTDYDPKKNYFDTAAVDKVIDRVIETGSNAVIVCVSPVVGVYRLTMKQGSDKWCGL